MTGAMDLSTHYSTGEEIRLGDRVLHHSAPAEIASVVGRDEFGGEFAGQASWYKRG